MDPLSSLNHCLLSYHEVLQSEATASLRLPLLSKLLVSHVHPHDDYRLHELQFGRHHLRDDHHRQGADARVVSLRWHGRSRQSHILPSFLEDGR